MKILVFVDLAAFWGNNLSLLDSSYPLAVPSQYPQQSDADGLIPRLQQENVNFTYHVGTMIELPRAALQAVWALHSVAIANIHACRH